GPRAVVLEAFRDMALRNRVGVGKLDAERLRTGTAAGKRRIPAEQRVRTGAPVVVPVIVCRDVSGLERRVVVEFLRADTCPRHRIDRAGVVVSKLAVLSGGVVRAVDLVVVVREG